MVRVLKGLGESHSRAMAVVVAVVARGGGYGGGGGGSGDGACCSCGGIGHMATDYNHGRGGCGGRYDGGGNGGSCNNCGYSGLLQGTAQQALAEKFTAESFQPSLFFSRLWRDLNYGCS
ncbi:uncharacterized protein LOC130962078 [Arachis stenosperma]|uniref:uncharacterized protein LOC130962078 n=1 Tax=Arachis stenosperma TaxID=217475 RepID=UPI0025AD5710|nr:uncharacterized protein LOC130962078 [Arachis stenosperma]